LYCLSFSDLRLLITPVGIFKLYFIKDYSDMLNRVMVFEGGIPQLSTGEDLQVSITLFCRARPHVVDSGCPLGEGLSGKPNNGL